MAKASTARVIAKDPTTKLAHRRMTVLELAEIERRTGVAERRAT